MNSSVLKHEDFQKIEKIGQGNFGEVYRGRNKITGQTVAIKIIDLDNSEDSLEEAQKEIHLQLACNSPYVTFHHLLKQKIR
jgi:serine/threonine-protein kinase 24/25/MST4